MVRDSNEISWAHVLDAICNKKTLKRSFMNDSVIEVEHLEKEFFYTKKINCPWYQKPFFYMFPQYGNIKAVNDISFSVAKGERVAFIGPNGAGKSTVVKMLVGILQPTRGTMQVLNLNPFCDRTTLAYNIGVVFGHNSQLWYHLPVRQSFELLGPMYDIDPNVFEQRLDHLVNTFKISHLLNKPLRQLSLGERMRCEIIASVLHMPRILFLDEPTIGLDIVAKAVLRDLIIELSQEYGITLLLTSHDTDDIERICNRAIIIDHGSLVLDKSIEELKNNYIKNKIISIVTDQPFKEWAMPGTYIVSKKQHCLKIAVDVEQVSLDGAIAKIFSYFQVKDLVVENPSLESIIRDIYEAVDSQ